MSSGRKIGGILIENSMQGSYLSSSVVGIGLNVNQTQFDLSGGNPTSMKLELGRTSTGKACSQSSLLHLTAWINKLVRKGMANDP